MTNSKSLVKFNVQNIQYALLNSEGGYDKPISYGTGIKIALEANSSTKQIRGDGRIIAEPVNDKGKTGAMTTNNISNEYEIAMGRKLQGQNGLMDIKQTKQVEHAIYFETCEILENGNVTVAKTWLYGVTSKRPNESYDQNGDDINESSFETALTINGTLLLDNQGEPYKDNYGNLMYAWQQTAVPGDAGYEDFGKTVVLPIVRIGE